MNQKNKTIGEVLRAGKARLKAAGKEAYAFEAELLLEKAAGLNRTALFLLDGENLSDEAAELYEGFLSEREQGRPTQYILGEWEFMGLPFHVGEGVLIPRGDTEVLVETILEKQQTESLKSILDIGTGSGCIPISLGHYGKFENIMAVDISQKALGYAAKNAAENNITIDFYESDLFSNVPKEWQGKLDAIVSNPPYIPKMDIEELMIEVKDFEPLNALDGGEDGLDFYRAIVEQGREWLKDGGWLFFEIGYDQGEALLSLLSEFGYTEIGLKQDLAGLDRVAFGRKGA
ncbi:peptide chain release factor N(5)-glutamine methyltransferase [Anaerotignum sp.]|nr:peptide chain release factor N(5)-glutamine methyltransferase [Anaerotignum sp.]MBQ7758727.1 peptide chain release factor N(5)-glutamine methyltransferase [Anaerotignum sp.]